MATASFIGREFDFQLLAALGAGTTEDQLLEAIDEAVSARLIEALPDKIEGYRFSHALIQQTLSEELTPSRRIRVHARIAEELEKFFGANAEAHAAELAHHFAQAEPVTGGAKLAHYALMAGEQALAVYAYEEALEHFQRALELKEDQPMDDEMAALLFGLGRCYILNIGSSFREARRPQSFFARAFNYYLEAGDIPQAVAVAEYPTGSSRMALEGPAVLISQALNLVHPDSYEAGRLLSRYGFILARVQGDYDGAQKALERALLIAQREGDLVLEMRTLANAAGTDLYHLHYRESAEKSLRVIEIARSTHDIHAELMAYVVAAQASDSMGDSQTAQQYASESLPLAERLQDHWWLATVHWLSQLMQCLAGNWEAARDHCERGLTAEPMNPRLLAGC